MVVVLGFAFCILWFSLFCFPLHLCFVLCFFCLAPCFLSLLRGCLSAWWWLFSLLVEPFVVGALVEERLSAFHPLSALQASGKREGCMRAAHVPITIPASHHNPP